MNLVARLRSWLKWMVNGRRLDREMETEMRFHIESYAAELVRKGMSQQEAMREARIEFGGIESHKDAMRAAHRSFVSNFGLRICSTANSS